MVLYTYSGAPNPRRVHMYLAEKGIEVPFQQVDLPKRENRSPDFLARVNPLGGLPVLELDDGSHVAESIAICRYFEETQPNPPLMGTDAKDRAIVEMWSRRTELEVARPIMQTFQNTHAFFKGRIPQVPEYGEVCRAHATKRLEWIDAELAKREFIAGPRYTIADITLLIGIDFGRVVKIGIQPEQKNLARWYEAVSSRPSAKA